MRLRVEMSPADEAEWEFAARGLTEGGPWQLG